MIPTKFKSFNPLWILVWIAVLAFYYLQFIGTLGLNVNVKDEWQASRIWIVSAECARTTGIPLVGCDGGKIVPYSDIRPSDDIGHALLLGAYSMATGNILTLDDAGKLNTVLNFSGVFLVAALLLAAQLQWAAIFMLLVGAFIGADHVAAMPHAGLIGITCLAMILPLAILLFQRAPTRKAVTWIAIGAITLSLAMILRQATGMMGVVATLLVLAYAQYSSKLWTRRTPLAALSLVLMLAAGYATTATLAIRDAIWSVPASTMMDRHGIQHNLFIGLGVVPNKFGIVWKDSFGQEWAKSIAPDIKYASQRYYDFLGNEYIRLLKSDPFEVIRIYIEKSFIFFQQPMGGWIWSSVPVIWGFIFAYAVYISQRSKDSPFKNQTDTVVITCSIFLLMHLGQAMAIHPSMQYASPVKFFLLLILASSLQLTLSHLGMRKPTAEEMISQSG